MELTEVVTVKKGLWKERNPPSRARGGGHFMSGNSMCKLWQQIAQGIFMDGVKREVRRWQRGLKSDIAVILKKFECHV